MYRVGVEAILGISLRDGRLHIDPCIPHDWRGFEVTVTRGEAAFHIVVENPAGVNRGVASIEVDGAPHDGDIEMAGVQGQHEVRVVLGGRR